MKLTATQLRNIIAEEIQSEAARPRPGDDIDISGLDAPGLRRLLTRVEVALRAAESASGADRLTARLVPIPPEEVADMMLPKRELTRFGGGFFKERTSTGKTRGFYGKTATGIVWQWDPSRGAWSRLKDGLISK